MNVLDIHEAHAFSGPDRILGPVSLQVRQGERLALVGRSGAGKSALLDLIFDRVQPRAALIPQELGLVPALSVFQNVFMGRLSSHSPWYNLANLIRPFRRELQAIEPLLETLSLAHRSRTPTARLSGGEKQRTAIARALFQGAEILLADEPVSALDGPLAHRVMATLGRRYSTSVTALHDIELALRYSTRIIGIRDGLVALDQPSSRLIPQDLLPIY